VDADREREKQYLLRWKTLGPILDEIRDREISELTPADTQSAMLMFDQAFRLAQRDLPPRTTSGLVEWQRCMMLWRERLERG